MIAPSHEDINKFLVEQYRSWNENRFDDMMACFRKIAPNGWTIEYVGQAPIEGEIAMAEMISLYGGKAPTKPITILINGNEAAACVDNSVMDSNASVMSIETYKFADGRMAVRYFHQLLEIL
jgi:hypothetical protein